MDDFSSLDIFLHDEKIGNIVRMPGDKNALIFEKNYVDDPKRATLSLSFQDANHDIVSEQKIIRTRLLPFFSNLLPEGAMRDFLARQAGVNSEREFYLLAALGLDLPGAIKILPSYDPQEALIHEAHLDEEISPITEEPILRFSLAGVQLKFSAIWDTEKGLTIPANGAGGEWIIKLPSSIYREVPENEYAMMTLAKNIGIDVPHIDLIPLNTIKGLHGINVDQESPAFIIKRFDRGAKGEKIHIEDFAQVFGVYPEKKYQTASYRNIAEVIWAEASEKEMVEFIRRFVFNALIGNGDMHLKNWSFIYPDKVKPDLAPAYDFLSTLPYIPNEKLALSFMGSKDFSSLTHEQFEKFAAKTGIPNELIMETLVETIKNFKIAWKNTDNLKLSLRNIIEEHLTTIPIYST